VEDRRVWIITACLIIAGLLLFILWPWLWLVRIALLVLFGGWALYLGGSGVLKLRGTFLEQEKSRHLIPPIDGRLPAWIDNDGYAYPLEQAPLPQGAHLNLTLKSGQSGPVQITEVPELPALPPRRPVAPPWVQARRDFVQGQLVLGYGANGPVKLEIAKAKSIAIVGKSGTGKSNTERYLLGQYDGQGAEHSIWDGHGDLSSELGGITEYPDMLADCERIWEIYRSRQEEYKQGRRDFPLFVLMIDEWKDMHKALKKTKDLISTLITGGRKYNMHLIVSSQYFRAEMFENGTGDLDSIWTRYLHWTDSRQAEYARVSDEKAQQLLADVESYGVIGFSIISHPSVETQVLAVSRTESADIRR
jgi:hypothetical protein